MNKTKTSQTAGRLKSRPQFLAVREGEKRKGGYFLLEVLDRNEPDSRPRVGFTVTKRHGNAVERNRMRRRLREAVRVSGQFAMLPGHDYVIVARRDVLTVSFEQLKDMLGARISARPKPPGKSNADSRKE